MKNEGCGVSKNWNCIILSVVVFATMYLLVVYMPNLKEFDANLLHSIRLALSPYSIAIPTFVSQFGYANHLLWPQIALGSVLLSHQKYLKAFLAIFFIQSNFLLTSTIKELVCRERPSALEGFSFPSMHSSMTMCFCGILMYFILANVSNKFWKYFIVTVLCIWIVMVGISRLWLGVHYPTDVVAGMFLGLMMANLFIVVSKFFDRA